MTTHQTTRPSRASLNLRSAFFSVCLALVGVFTSALPTFAREADIIVTIQQQSSGRFLDAWDDGTHDYALVTRPAQNNSSQQWIIHWDESGNGTGTLQQVSTYRFMDAHEIAEKDYQLVTRPQQTDNTQNWQISSVGGGLYTILQVSSGRFMDAHEIAEKDFAVVTRPRQSDNTQLWRLTVVGHPD